MARLFVLFAVWCFLAVGIFADLNKRAAQVKLLQYDYKSQTLSGSITVS